MTRIIIVVLSSAVLGLCIFFDVLEITLRLMPWQRNSSRGFGSRTSSRTTSFIVDPIFQNQYDIIDSADMNDRCRMYGFGYNSSQKPRRIFFGAMVADESYDIIRIHAAETYGLYDVVALVESNATHMNTPRTLRFDPGTDGYDLFQSGIFGPNASVYLDIFDGDAFVALDLDREEIQREEILLRWKKAGMREDDVGLMADFDETMSRDFLIAGIHCDIPEFRPGQSCHWPRVHAWSMVFEGSPECINSVRWYHPDFMLGECIKYVGDSRGHPTPVRYFMGKYGERADGWGHRGGDDYPYEVLNNGSFPLANAADMRTGIHNYALHDVQFFPAGYHFHNFFETGSELRNKYLTYAHGNPDIPQMTLSEIQDDIDLMVRCAHGLPNSANPAGMARVEGGFDAILESVPIYFRNKTYRRQRQSHVKKLVEEDERDFGTNYSLH